MSLNEFVLAVDIGTGSTKAVLFDADLRQVSTIKKFYPILAPHRSWSEQEPETILSAVCEAIRETVVSLPENSRLLALSFSSQLYSILAVDSAGKALTSSLTWLDTRSAEAARAIGRRPEAQEIYQRTGCPIDAIYPLAKIGWLKENFSLPEQVKFISIKEYVLFHLLGRFVADWSTASASGLFDISRQQWAEAALALLNIGPANLSEVVPPRRIFTEWNGEVIRRLGLPSGIPLVIGGGDGPLASLGVGAHQAGVLAVNVGTSAAARLVISEARVDPGGRLWTYVVDEKLWVIGGIVSSGGLVYDWFLKNFLAGTGGPQENGSLEHLHEYAGRMAAAAPPGAEELLFIPYLGGEQCPVWQPDTRGSFFGLDFRHDRSHLIRAVLEGITRSIYRVAESIRAASSDPLREVRVTGGLTSSPVWLQLAADMFGYPVVVPEIVEGSARGAALLAAVALGLRSSLQDFPDPAVGWARVYPRPDIHRYYEQQYQKFQQILECARSV